MTLCPWLHDACSSYWRLAVSIFTPAKTDRAKPASALAAGVEAIEVDDAVNEAGGAAQLFLGEQHQQHQQHQQQLPWQQPTKFVRTKFSGQHHQHQQQHQQHQQQHHQHHFEPERDIRQHQEHRKRKRVCLGGLHHSNSRSSDGGPIYRYVSSLSLELREAKASSCYYFSADSSTAGKKDDDDSDNDDDDGISLASSEPIDRLWPAAARLAADLAMSTEDCRNDDGGGADSATAPELVATQLLERLAENDLAGAIRHCRMLLTFQPHSEEARELLATLTERDRQLRDDLLESDSESTDTESETYFRYFHHDQHGRNEDEAESRRTSSGEPDHFLDASSSSD